MVRRADGSALMATLSAAGQLDAAAKQVAAAGASVPLLSIGAEIHPSDFLARPDNAVGAYARAAYWLAVGSRPSQPGTRGNASLYAAAASALAQAKGQASKWIDTGSINFIGGTTVPAQVDAILYAAESTAKKNGRSDIAALFNQQRGAAPTVTTSGTSIRTGLLQGGSLVTIAVALPFVIGATYLLFAPLGKELELMAGSARKAVGG